MPLNKEAERNKRIEIDIDIKSITDKNESKWLKSQSQISIQTNEAARSNLKGSSSKSYEKLVSQVPLPKICVHKRSIEEIWTHK